MLTLQEKKKLSLTGGEADKLVSVRNRRLLKEFKNCLPERTAVYLNEQKVSTLQQAAKLADEFTLTHKTVFVRRESSQNKSTTKPDAPVCSVNPAGPKPDRPCYYYLKSGHLIADFEAWKQRQRSASKQPKGVGLIDTSHRTSIESLTPTVLNLSPLLDLCLFQKRPKISAGLRSCGTPHAPNH